MKTIKINKIESKSLVLLSAIVFTLLAIFESLVTGIIFLINGGKEIPEILQNFYLGDSGIIYLIVRPMLVFIIVPVVIEIGIQIINFGIKIVGGIKIHVSE